MGILIVDDHEDNRTMLETVLRKAGFTGLSSADSAGQALTILGVHESKVSEEIDAILMDINMPDVDGIQATREIKSDERLQDVPIIMVTGHADDKTLQAAFEAGAMDFIAKPVNSIQLIARLKSALRLREEMKLRKMREDDLREFSLQLAMTNAALQRISQVDSLTGLANRRHLDSFLELEMRRSTRTGNPLSLMMIDVDHFKAYNDAAGHGSGDECLRKVAAALRGELHRPTDLAARYGGEEFVVVLVDTDLEGSKKVAESLRAAAESLGIPHPASSTSNCVTISVGVASVQPATRGSIEELMRAADSMLYAAKRAGRNRVAASALRESAA